MATSEQSPDTGSWLSLAMRVSGAGWIIFFGGAAIFLATGIASLHGDGWLAQLSRWQPHSIAYELMIIVIYVVWGVFMWIGARHPERHRLFVQFSIWANVGHGIVMLLLALFLEGHAMHLASDVPLTFIPSVLLAIASRRTVWQ